MRLSTANRTACEHGLFCSAVPGNGIDNSDVLKALSKAVAQTVGKPEQWVMVSLTTDKPMCYSGTEAPCAYGELVSIGAIGGDKNKTVSRIDGLQ